MIQPFITNYRKAWLDFKKTTSYKEASDAMKKKGIQQPYRDNILLAAFESAWNAAGAEIKQL